MILVILGIFIALAIVASIAGTNDRWRDGWYHPGACIGWAGIIVAITVCVGLGINVTRMNVIDEKIAMYQEENQAIEQQIATVVEQYQSYEKDVFKNSTTESAITLVSLYPELKSDKLVSKQLDVYVKNNNKIKKLKVEKIEGSVIRWWLYFGR